MVAGSSLTLTVSPVLNAAEAIKTSSFAIYTYYDPGQYDSLVDDVTSGVTVTMTAQEIAFLSVLPSSYTNN
jgi:hypothetical protein